MTKESHAQAAKRKAAKAAGDAFLPEEVPGFLEVPQLQRLARFLFLHLPGAGHQAHHDEEP